MTKNNQMDTATAFQAAQQKRRELLEAARGIGVSEEYISDLVEAFYVRVQADDELGPVFDHVVNGRWPEHLAKMKRFWSSVALRSAIYEGKPMVAHKALTEARPEHFVIWMRLFEQTLRDTAPSEAVVDYFMGFARTMAARLQSAMFGGGSPLEGGIEAV
jgi:hemoglobin